MSFCVRSAVVLAAIAAFLPAALGAPPQRAKPPAVAYSEADILGRADAALDALARMSADFVQVGASGRSLSGRLYVSRPGKLRFEYLPPAPLEIVSDGTTVIIRDRKLKTRDTYPVGKTPLKFLLAEHVRLARDAKVTGVVQQEGSASVFVEDPSTTGGTSKIEIVFGLPAFSLQGWVVTDPQGYVTTVSLKNISPSVPEDPNLFSIDFSRPLSP